MAKEYSFIEVIQMIKPGQVYKCTDENFNVREISMYETGRYIQIKQDTGEYAMMISSDARYLLVQVSVTFMEAVNSGKRIRPENDIFKSISDWLTILGLSQTEVALESMNGKWYIEEDEE